MNKKLIAAAVSAAVMAPVAAQAEVSVYGRINNAIDMNDLSDAPDADSSTNLSSVSSRFGIKYDQDIGGSGYAAHGKYEFGTTTDKESGNSYVRSDDATKSGTTGVDDIRVATVGLSGPFGRLDVGNQWSAYFDTFGTLVSPTYSLGYYIYSSVGFGILRSSNTIKYSNTFGPVYLELDVRLNEDDAEGSAVAEKARGDGVGLGLSFEVVDGLTIAVAVDSESRDNGDDTPAAVAFTNDNTPDDGILATAVVTGNTTDRDEDRLGIAAKYTYGDYWVSLGFQNYEQDDLTLAASGNVNTADDATAGTAVTSVEVEGADVDSTILYFGGNFTEQTNWLLGFSEADDGREASDSVYTTSDGNVEVVTPTDDSSSFVWGVYHNLGGGLKIYWEGTSFESENQTIDGTRHFLGMRVDF